MKKKKLNKFNHCADCSGCGVGICKQPFRVKRAFTKANINTGFEGTSEVTKSIPLPWHAILYSLFHRLIMFTY